MIIIFKKKHGTCPVCRKNINEDIGADAGGSSSRSNTDTLRPTYFNIIPLVNRPTGSNSSIDRTHRRFQLFTPASSINNNTSSRSHSTGFGILSSSTGPATTTNTSSTTSTATAGGTAPTTNTYTRSSSSSNNSSNRFHSMLGDGHLLYRIHLRHNLAPPSSDASAGGGGEERTQVPRRSGSSGTSTASGENVSGGSGGSGSNPNVNVYMPLSTSTSTTSSSNNVAPTYISGTNKSLYRIFN